MTTQANPMQWFRENSLIGFCQQRTPWHAQAGNDNLFPGAVPDDRAIALFKKAHAIESDVFTHVGGSPFKIDGHKSIVLPGYANHVAGIMGEGYQIHQYLETLYQTMRNLTNGGAGIASMGLLDNGARAWVQIEAPDNVNAAGMKFRPGLLAGSSLDGSLATVFKRTLVAVVCDNTFAWALQGSGDKVRVKHTRLSLDTLHNSGEAIEALHALATEAGYTITKAADKRVTDDQFRAFLAKLVPIADDATANMKGRAESKKTEIAALYNTDPRCTPWHGTALGVMQAVNTWQNHDATVKGTSRPERNLGNVISGKLDTIDSLAWETLNKVLVTA